jgi:UDP-N-acetylmuramoyl-tripeptide--D-alanyl-D-alanine ligase
MSINQIYDLYKKHPQISTDSRQTGKGSLFFALKGDNFDGNTYAAAALENGAAYCVIDDAEYKISDRYIVVDNVLSALQELAKHHRLELGIPVIAVTGTNGKTTTKELITAVLSEKFRVTATRGNLNNHIGVPLTLLSMDTTTQIGVVEMGANHAGEIDALCEIAVPDFGLITNVGKAHLEGFGSFEGVKKAKGELYRFIEKRAGRIFLNTSNPHLSEMAGAAGTIPYKTTPEGKGIEGRLVQSAPMMVIQARFPVGWLYIKTNLVGGYNLENVLAAVCTGNFFGVGPLKIAGAIERYRPSDKRSQLIKGEHNRIIMDAYNANPTSMDAALGNFETFDGPPKGVILGDMLELGGSSQAEHQKIVDKLVLMAPALVFLAGEMFSKCLFPSGFHVFANSELLVKYISDTKPRGYIFLIKGSRGMRLETVLDKL